MISLKRVANVSSSSYSPLNLSCLLQRLSPRTLATGSTVQAKATSCFKTVGGPIVTEHSVYYKHLQNKYEDSMKFALSGGGPKAIERHVKKNKKMLATDRLQSLLDDKEEFLELGTFSGQKMEYGDIPRAGVITGIGKVNGIHCMCIVNDGSVKGGTIYPIAVKKQLRAQEIALQNRLPCIYVVDSGGAFLPLQSEIFPDKEDGGKSFYNEAILNSEDIPQLSIVVGHCTAGGAYVPTMTSEAVIVHKVGYIFLGGPPLVYAALGERVSAEELGGATMHCSVSGCTDHFAATEPEAYELGRDIVATFNVEPQDEPQAYDEPQFDPEELAGLITEQQQHCMDPYQVIARIVDGSRFQDFKAKFGSNIVNGFAHIEGHLVGIVANNGSLDTKAALKASHFVQLCSQRSIPLVFLQNTTPDTEAPSDIEDAVAHGERLRAHASLMSAVAVADVPKFTVVIGNSFGDARHMMCGRAFSPNFLFAWPNARIAIEEPVSLLDAVRQEAFPTGAHMSSDQYRAFHQRVAMPLLDSTSAFHSSSRGWDDGVILPQHTRQVLGRCLNIVNQCSWRKNKELKSVFRM